MKKNIKILLLSSCLCFLSCLNVSAQTAECIEAGRLFRNAVDLSDASVDEERLYVRSIQLCPSMAEANYNLGVVFSRRKDLAAAENAFKKALDIAKRPEFYTALGNLKISQKDFSSAQSQFENAIDLDSSYVGALLGMGIVYDSLGSYSKAEEVLNKAALINQRDPIVQYNLGVVLERQDRLQDAISAFENAVKSDESHFGSHFELGLAYQKAGRYEDSRMVLERAANINSENAPVNRALGVTYEKLTQYDRAELAFRRALKLEGSDIISMINLGVVLLSKPGPNPLEAESILSNSLKLDSKNSKALTALGWAQIELGRHAAAEDTLRQAIEIDGNNAFAHNNLGVLYLRTGRNDDAEIEFKKAISLSPDLAEAKRNLKQFAN